MAEALISSLLGKIGDILMDFLVDPIRRQFTYVCCFKSNIKELETHLKELRRIQEGVQRRVVDDECNVREIDTNVKDWLERAKKVLSEVDGIIQGNPEVLKALSQTPQCQEPCALPFSNPEVKQCCLNGWCHNLKLRYSLSRKLVKKTKAIPELKADGKTYTKFSYGSTPACMLTLCNPDFEEFESRKQFMEEVLETLRHDKINLIGICGLPGVGKTEMVREVGRRVKEEKLFDEVGFVTVGPSPDLQNVQNSIADNFGLQEMRNHVDVEMRARLLRKRLSQDKKILLILDDIWAAFDLEKHGIPLKSANGTFKLVYTSRQRGHWNKSHKTLEIALGLLMKNEPWKLFRAKAALADVPKFKPTAEKIVNACGCLPLALANIGGTLSDSGNYQIWEDILKRLDHITTNPAHKELFLRLEPSYNYLDEDAKDLFLLCCEFGKQKSIRLGDVAKYALGLSLFDGLDGMREVRNRVTAIFLDLRKRYLLLDGEYGPDSVKMHDLVRNMGIHIASNIDKVALVSHGVASDWPKKDTYKNYNTISVISEKITELPDRILECRDLKFLLLQCRNLKELYGNFFEGMDKLKVLELKDFLGTLELPYLKNLTMLSLEGFDGKLDNIVEIAKLENLEILSFRDSGIKELPQEVAKLLKLRLLDLITRARMTIPPHVIECLVSLEELYIGDNYVSQKEFMSLTKLNILQIGTGESTLLSVPSVLAEVREEYFRLNNRHFEVLQVIHLSETSILSAGTVLSEESTESVTLNTSESTESISLKITSESTESIPLNATTLPLTSVPSKLIGELSKSTESANILGVTFESTNSVPPNATTMSLTSANMEVTSESTESVKPPSQESGPSKVITSKLPSPRLTDQELTKARDDAIDLHRAFQGRSCDATTIVTILADRSAKHRSLIRQEYKKKFSEDFDDRLSEELKFKRDLKRALKLWMDDPARRDAKLVKHGLSRNLNVAIEVICSRTPSEIERMKKAYRSMFGSYLLADIECHASFDHKKLLLAYVGTPRSESREVDETMVDRDAKALFKDGESKLGVNYEETFIRIFSERSSAHLAAVNIAYRIMSMNSLKKAVKKETSWKFKSALLTILQCAENRGKYFAKALHKAMKGIGTDYETLTRIIVSRAEVDIQQIKTEYRNKYRKPLSDVVHSDTSGPYRAFLLALLNHNTTDGPQITCL